MQLPLPKHINPDIVIGAIVPEKDVDGFHIINAGRLTVGIDGMVPCTPLGCMELLRSYQSDLTGLHALIVGRSNIVGKPLSTLLLREHCTVTIAHSKTRNLPEVCKQADILIAAVGNAHLIKGDWVKPGAIVIDVGITELKPIQGKMSLSEMLISTRHRKWQRQLHPFPVASGR